MSEDNKELTFQEIIDKINEQLQISDGSISKPTIDELNQFQKTWFYHNWDVRFRKLASFQHWEHEVQLQSRIPPLKNGFTGSMNGLSILQMITTSLKS